MSTDPRYEAIVLDWLGRQGVLCDCDDGWHKMGLRPHQWKRCDRCVLVEVGGIRVRWLKGRRFIHSHPADDGVDLMLPAVEVTDE